MTIAGAAGGAQAAVARISSDARTATTAARVQIPVALSTGATKVVAVDSKK